MCFFDIEIYIIEGCKIIFNLYINIKNMYNWPKRKNQRLRNYDYSQNWFYFVTICTKNRENYFGEILDWKMILNEYWKIAQDVLLNLPNHYKNSIIDEYIFMPNHFHWIIIIENATIVGNGFKPFPTEHWLSEIIRGFKTFSSRIINNLQNDFMFSWQKSFYDMIIRNEEQLNKTRKYIIDNPLKWEFDKNNLVNVKK